jgi:GT2 family glycosyltransferase
MISLIIPTTGTNKEYTDNLIDNIRKIYSNENEVEIILQEDNTVTLGINYNNAIIKANGDKIILLHNDMVIKPGFIEIMDKHIIKNRITTYTRIEPPIFPDIYPGKVLFDYGSDLNTFNKELFNNYQIEESLIDGGSQLFFGCLKEDYIGIDGYTFKMFCEDDDLHLRYKLAGFEHKVSSAHVYHFVSKTSRQGNYQDIELQSNRNFIRKWGNRDFKVKFDIGYIIKNCNPQLIPTLELFASTIYVDCPYIDYIKTEQPNTKFDLNNRIKNINEPKTNQILIEFDATQLNQNNFQLLQQLPQIISESGGIGIFELDIFKIDISGMDRLEQYLIEINSPYYQSQFL